MVAHTPCMKILGLLAASIFGVEFLPIVIPIPLRRLYEDPSIIHRNKIAAGNYPDIQAAADEIARYRIP